MFAVSILISISFSGVLAEHQTYLTFSHTQTFGEADRAYYDDTQHFNYPYGIATDGAYLWIADSDGNRAVKFDSNGIYQNFTIGSSGFSEFYENEGENVFLDWIADIGVDSSGNIWLVDGGANHVAKFNSGGEYQSSLGLIWSSGAGNDRFNRPIGIAFDSSGNIYISDQGNHRVQIFDNTGTYLTTLGAYGNGDLNFDRPEHIAIYGNSLYVADRDNQRVQIYNITNPLSITYIATLGSLDNSGSSNDKFDNPSGVAADASYIYVADTVNDRIQIFNNSAPFAWVATIGSYGVGDDGFSWVEDVAVDSSGNIYVADSANQRIQKFTNSWTYSLTYGTTGVPYLTDQLHYNAPTDIALDSNQNIYISEGKGRRVVKIQRDGAPIWQVGEPGIFKTDNDHFGSPQGIAIDSTGRVFVSDAENHRIQVFDRNGFYISTVGAYGPNRGEFNYPLGVAIDDYDNLYVADKNNCRFQIFNKLLESIVAFGSCGSGNYQFQDPRDVAVDSNGNIYIVDTGNHRVQVYNSSRTYLRSIGLTGVADTAYDRLSSPTAIAIDSLDRVYIADNWGDVIKVYDKNGNFLDCIANAWGNFQGNFREIKGLAVDAGGNLYLADSLSHQIKKYKPSAFQGWRQMNVTGFGKQYNWGIWSMTMFNDQLLASSANSYEHGAELYRFENGDWTQVMSGGFGDANNKAIDIFAEFNHTLYAGTWNETSSGGSNGGQLWRSTTAADGSWEEVANGGFGSTTNSEIMSMKTFNGFLYAGTWSVDTSDHGAEIFRSASGDSGTWTKVFDDSIPSHHIADGIMVMEVFSNTLFAGLANWDSSAELWSTTDGTTWTQVGGDGLGDPNNTGIISLAVFDGKLYAGVRNYNKTLDRSQGAQIYRSENGITWEKVVNNGFNDPANCDIGGLIVYRNKIYAITNNYNYENTKQHKGIGVWRSSTGNLGDWVQVSSHSFGLEQGSAFHKWNGNFTVYDDLLYIGTASSEIGGGRIWSYFPESSFLSIIQR